MAEKRKEERLIAKGRQPSIEREQEYQFEYQLREDGWKPVSLHKHFRSPRSAS